MEDMEIRSLVHRWITQPVYTDDEEIFIEVIASGYQTECS